MISKKGFTLVEMLVVISILSVVGVLILTIFTRTLKGNNKAQIIGGIKQNGQSVLETMDKTIRNSDNVVCPSNDSPSNVLTVVKNGNNYTRYRFVFVSATVNGFIQQDSPIRENTETDKEFKDRVCLTTDPTHDAVILTDNNLQTGVSVENGAFIQSKSAGFKNQVTIKFDLKPGIEAPASIAGQIDSVNFRTSIQLR